MATTNSIGTTGRDYTTLQSWEDAVPATPTDGYIGECYNDSEFAAGVTISGHTTSAANFITLTAAAGQSFQDHSTVRTNPLYYDQTKGVGVAASPGGAFVVDVFNDYTTVSRLQIQRNGSSYANGCVRVDGSLPNVKVKDCILFKNVSASINIAVMRVATISNCVIVDVGATAAAIALSFFDAPGTAINVTVVRVGTAGGTGMIASYSGPVARNCAVFNFTTNFTGTFGASSGYNGTNAASAPGSNNQVSLTYANQFESTTNDFRLKTGATLIDTGNTDATNAPNDISGTVRGTGFGGDIGAWEIAGAAAASIPPILMPPMRPAMYVRQ